MNQKKINRVAIRLVQESPLVSEEYLSSPEKAAEVVGDYIRNMDREVLCTINLNAKLQPINFNIASIGTVNQTLAVPRDLLKTAILSNATNMMVLHNHPSGDLTPSKEDIKITSRLISICELVGIPLLDHIIVGPSKKEFFSMKEKCTVPFKGSVKYEERLEYLNFKTNIEEKVAEKNSRSAR